MLGTEAGDTAGAPRAVHDLGGHEIHRGRADEAGDEQVPRLTVELLRRADLLQDAELHDGDSVPHRHRLDLIVRDVDGRRVELLLQLEDLRTGLDPQLCVEIRQRLVHQKRLGLANDRTTQRDALALASGELLRLALDQRVEIENVRRPAHAPVDVLLGHLLIAQAEREVVVHGHVRIERVGLEHHRDVPVLRCDVVDDAVADQDPPVRHSLETGEHAQCSALAAAGRTDEDHELAVTDLEHEVVDGRGVAEASS